LRFQMRITPNGTARNRIIILLENSRSSIFDFIHDVEIGSY
jgi:hypothetical protein